MSGMLNLSLGRGHSQIVVTKAAKTGTRITRPFPFPRYPGLRPFTTIAILFHRDAARLCSAVTPDIACANGTATFLDALDGPLPNLSRLPTIYRSAPHAPSSHAVTPLSGHPMSS